MMSCIRCVQNITWNCLCCVVESFFLFIIGSAHPPLLWDHWVQMRCVYRKQNPLPWWNGNENGNAQPVTWGNWCWSRFWYLHTHNRTKTRSLTVWLVFKTFEDCMSVLCCNEDGSDERLCWRAQKKPVDGPEFKIFFFFVLPRSRMKFHAQEPRCNKPELSPEMAVLR